MSANETVTTETAEPKTPKTMAVTLTANGTTMRIRARRKRDGTAETFVTTTDATKKTCGRSGLRLQRAHAVRQALHRNHLRPHRTVPRSSTTATSPAKADLVQRIRGNSTTNAC